MLQAVKPTQVKSFRDNLKRTFIGAKHQKVQRRLNTPGMPAEEIELIWLPEAQLWSHFSKRALHGTRWVCWFGTKLPDIDRISSPSIEINLSLDPTDKTIAGRALYDGEGRFYLGHKGILGGGRGGQMDMATFGSEIRGFVREGILLRPNTEENVFRIGELDSNGFLLRLHEFVSECERLRALARQRGDLDNTTPDPVFNPEYEIDGLGYRTKEQIYKIKRQHARIINALQKEIGQDAVNGLRNYMKPDLYVCDKRGDMKILFEVKVHADTQSWFTALGQLVVYGSIEKSTPIRVLVCPTSRPEAAFSLALKALQVQIVLYEYSRNKYSFSGLDNILRQL